MKSPRVGWVLVTSLMMVVGLALPARGASPLIHNAENLGSTKSGGTWGMPGGTYGEFTCATCHSRTTTNVKRIVTSIPATIGPALDKPVVFRNMTAFGDDTLTRTSSKKICEVCHTQTAYHRYDTTGQTVMTHPNGDCTECHPHSIGFRATGCTACHGHNAASPLPISSGRHTAHVNNVSVLGSNYGCATCHAPTVSSDTQFSNPANHKNGTVNYGGSTAGTYDPGTGTCTSYCHTDGRGGAPAMPVTWSGGPSLDCKGCHGGDGTLFGAPTYATGNSHAKHVGSASDCVNCHYATTENGTTITGSHTNQSIDVSSIGGIGWNGGAKSCSTASCHANVYGSGTVTTPVWGTAAAQCTACHTVPIGAAGPNTGSHAKHGAAACTACHAAGTTATTMPSVSHNDGDIDVTVGGYPANVAKHAAGSGYSTCSNVTCHSSGKFTPAPATWGATLNCKGCHASLSAGHTIHVSTLLDERASSMAYTTYSANASTGTSYRFGCANCHPVILSYHLNGTIDVDLTTTAGSGALKARNGAASYNGSKQCLNVYCHSNGYVASTVFATTPAWGGTFTGDRCAACHGNSPGNGKVGSSAHGAHEVGIHYRDVFSGSSGKLPIASTNPAVNAAHGYGRATTLSCNVCHNDTVTTPFNAKNPTCGTAGCHGTGGVYTTSYATIANTAMHVNGQVDLKLLNAPVRSKAQLRASSFDSYTAASEGGWARWRGYKNMTSAYDYTRQTLLAGSTVTRDATTTTCATACHANKTITWNATGVSCQNCHSRL